MQPQITDTHIKAKRTLNDLVEDIPGFWRQVQQG